MRLNGMSEVPRGKKQGMDISKLKDKDREVAELIGIENYQKLISRYGGGNIYIPSASLLNREELKAEIRREYNGDNAAKLGQQYGLSARTIVRIVTKKEL